jgi:hypothetical protein
LTSNNHRYRLALGLRHLFLPWLEFDGSVGRNWLNQASNDASMGLLFSATGRLALGVNYTHNGVTNNTAGLMLRLYF